MGSNGVILDPFLDHLLANMVIFGGSESGSPDVILALLGIFRYLGSRDLGVSEWVKIGSNRPISGGIGLIDLIDFNHF